MSSYGTITTKRIRRRKPLKSGDVPMPQLYREISEGYEYFLAKQMKRDALKSRRQKGRK